MVCGASGNGKPQPGDAPLTRTRPQVGIVCRHLGHGNRSFDSCRFEVNRCLGGERGRKIRIRHNGKNDDHLWMSVII